MIKRYLRAAIQGDAALHLMLIISVYLRILCKAAHVSARKVRILRIGQTKEEHKWA